MNLLQNPLFDPHWGAGTRQHPEYHNIFLPDGWDLGFLDREPFDGIHGDPPGLVAHRPEANGITHGQFEPELTPDDPHTWKVFVRNPLYAWLFPLRPPSAPAGTYALTVKVWPKLHLVGEPGNPHPADPWAGEVGLFTGDATDIAWRSGLAYDRYNVLTWEFSHPGGALDMAIMFKGKYPVDNSFFFHRAELRAVDAPPPPPPTCRGKPRLQYTRVVNVIPQEAATARAAAIFAQAWSAGRQTVTGSYDDAGVGDLDHRTARLWDIPEAEEPISRAWYAEHYPGVTVEFVGHADPPPPPPPPAAALSQRDPRWKDRRFGGNTCALTIGQAGCFITGIAEAQRIYGIRPDATPVTVDETVGQAGYSMCRLTWAAISTQLGMTITSEGNLNAHLDAGRVALLRVLPETPEHFVLAVRRVGNDYLIRDPWYGTEELLSNRYRGVQSFRLLTPKPAPPPPPPPPITARQFTGLHIQQAHQELSDAVLEFHIAGTPNMVKVLDSAGWAQKVYRVNTSVKFVYRHVVDFGYQDHLLRLPPAQACAEFYSHQAANLSAFPFDYVGGLNEIGGAGEMARFVAFESAWIDFLAARGMKATVGAWSIGNPDLGLLPQILPLARKCQERGALMDYHWYVPTSPWCNFWETAPGTNRTWYQIRWPDYHGRWVAMDDYFVSQGVRLGWCFGEYGAISIDRQGHMDPGQGWRHPECLNADTGRLIELLRLDAATLNQTRAAREGRVKGALFFTINQGNHPDNWPHFQLSPHDLRRLAVEL